MHQVADHVVILNQLTRSILSVVCVMIGLRLLDVFTEFVFIPERISPKLKFHPMIS